MMVNGKGRRAELLPIGSLCPTLVLPGERAIDSFTPILKIRQVALAPSPPTTFSETPVLIPLKTKRHVPLWGL